MSSASFVLLRRRMWQRSWPRRYVTTSSTYQVRPTKFDPKGHQQTVVSKVAIQPYCMLCDELWSVAVGNVEISLLTKAIPIPWPRQVEFQWLDHSNTNQNGISWAPFSGGIDVSVISHVFHLRHFKLFPSIMLLKVAKNISQHALVTAKGLWRSAQFSHNTSSLFGISSSATQASRANVKVLGACRPPRRLHMEPVVK